MKPKKCINCKYVKHLGPYSVCKLLEKWIKNVNEGVDCKYFEPTPWTCASCGAEIIGGKKASNPLRYRSGKHKGEVKPCCDNPDWRVCPNRECEADGAVICKNCGHYYGDITW